MHSKYTIIFYVVFEAASIHCESISSSLVLGVTQTKKIDKALIYKSCGFDKLSSKIQNSLFSSFDC